LLGQIRGQMVLDVKQALAAYTAVRLAHLSTVTALATGGAALMAAGAGMAAIGIGMAAALWVAVDAAADFERKLDYFAAVSASTQDEYDAIREKAIQLGQDTIYSAGQIADSFVELGKAGVSAKDIIGGIGEGVAALGAAADIPLDTAAVIMMSAVQSFGLGADQAVHVADQLAGAANASIVEVEDLGISLKYAGGVASSLGVSFDETLTALGLLGQYGIRGSTAGTSLRQTLVSLTGSTAKAKTRLKELGIITADGTNQFFNADGSAKTLAESFQILQDATKGMSDEARLSAFKDIFAVRALPSVIALTKEGAAGFEEMSAAIGSTTALDVANQRLDNLSGDLEILRGNLETLAIENGSTLQEFFRGVVQGITDVVQWFNNLDADTQALIIRIIAFAATGFIIIGFLGMMAGAILNIIGFLMKLGPALKLVGTIVGWVGRAIGMAFGISNPIGWIILAITALVAAFIWLWNNVEGFRNFFIMVWDAIVVAAQAAWEWFLNLGPWFSNLWNSIVDWTTSAWESVTSFIGSIPGRITGFFSSIGAWFSNLWNNITTGVSNGWNAVLAFFQSLPGRIAAFFASLPARIGYIIGFMIGTVVRLIVAFGTWVGTAIPALINSIVTWFQQLPTRIAVFLAVLWANIVQIWTNIKTWLITTVTTLIAQVIVFFSQLPGRVVAFFQNLATGINNWMIRAAVWALQKAREIKDGVINFIRELPGRVREFFSNLVDTIREKLGQAVATAKEMASNILNGIVDTIVGLPDTVAGILNNVIDAFLGVVGRAWDAAKEFASGLWEGFKDGLGIHSPSYIEHAMWDITDVVETETRRLSRMTASIQSIGNRMVGVGIETGNRLVRPLATAAATMATEYKKIQDTQANLSDMSMNYTISQTAMSRLPNDAWGSQYGPPKAPPIIAQVNQPPADVRMPDRITLVDSEGDILAVTRVQTEDVMDENIRRQSMVGRSRR
jgi:TP901 family phage tail tape measure protein